MGLPSAVRRFSRASYHCTVEYMAMEPHTNPNRFIDARGVLLFVLVFIFIIGLGLARDSICDLL